MILDQTLYSMLYLISCYVGVYIPSTLHHFILSYPSLLYSALHSCIFDGTKLHHPFQDHFDWGPMGNPLDCQQHQQAGWKLVEWGKEGVTCPAAGFVSFLSSSEVWEMK